MRPLCTFHLYKIHIEFIKRLNTETFTAIALARMFCLWIKVSLTNKQLTSLSISIFQLKLLYQSYTSMLHSQMYGTITTSVRIDARLRRKNTNMNGNDGISHTFFKLMFEFVLDVPMFMVLYIKILLLRPQGRPALGRNSTKSLTPKQIYLVYNDGKVVRAVHSDINANLKVKVIQ